MAYALEMKHITKRFPGVLANEDVNLTVGENEIHGLIGENGAGKSTLMNILYGLLPPDEGGITLFSKEVSIPSPNAAIELGVGHVASDEAPGQRPAHRVAAGGASSF